MDRFGSSRPAPQPYVLEDGDRVPSVTTIISRFKDAAGLVHWAWDQGRHGKDYRESRDAAADAGTLAHAMVEADIRGKVFVPPPSLSRDTYDKAGRAFANYLEWKAQTTLKPQQTELRLVSETYKFGGTLDAILVSNKLCLGDWKTSNSVREDYLIQLAAYALLWEETYPGQPIEGFHLIRFAKEHADFSHYYFEELEDAKYQFLDFRACYERDKRLKARVR